MIALTTRDGGDDAMLQCDAPPGGRDDPTPVQEPYDLTLARRA